jgi:hypothetical protein
VSLLPSATEIVFALELGGDLRGVSFECDYPEPARTVPVVSGTALPTDGSLTAQEIDAAVSARIAAGESIYTLDDALIRAIDPDLILAQDLCEVCAVPSGAVEEALEVIGCHAQVVSLDPGRLDEVIACIGVAGGPSPGCWYWNGPTRRSTRGTGCPIRWRRRAECRSSPPPVPGHADSLGRRSAPNRSTSPSSCRAGSTWRARWRKRLRSWPVPRPRASVESSLSTPTGTSHVPDRGSSTGWSCWRVCCTRSRPYPRLVVPGSCAPETDQSTSARPAHFHRHNATPSDPTFRDRMACAGS